MWTPLEASTENDPYEGFRYSRLWFLAGSLMVGFWADYASYYSSSQTSDTTWADITGFCALGLTAPIFLLVSSITIVLAKSAADLAFSGAWLWCRVGGEIWILLKFCKEIKRLLDAKRSEAFWQEEHRLACAALEREAMEVLEHLRTRREELLRAHEDVARAIQLLFSVAKGPFEQAMLGLLALKGCETASFEDAVWSDVARLFARFGAVGAQGSVSLIEVTTVVALLVGMSDKEAARAAETALTTMQVKGELKAPSVLVALKFYDSAAKLQTTSRAAGVYHQVAKAGFVAAGAQFATRLVLDAYDEMLAPFLRRSGYEEGTDQHQEVHTFCKDCLDGYSLLGLARGCAIDEITAKRRALTEVLHPDRLGEMSMSVRTAAERQLMSVNAASDHLAKCLLRESGLG